MRDDFGHTPHLSVSYEYDFPTAGGFWFAGKWVCTHPTSPSYTTRDFGEIMGHLMVHSEIDPVDVSHGILQLMEKHYSEIAHLRGQAGEASTELKEELTEKVSTMPRTAWVVPDDPEERKFPNRDSALARAWELTPAGGKRAEPREVETAVAKVDPVFYEDFDFEVTGLDLVADEGYVLSTEMRIPADSPLDMNRDSGLIWEKAKTRIRREAAMRGMVPVNGTVKNHMTYDELDGATVLRSRCTVREPTDGEKLHATLPAAGARSGRFTVTPPPLTLTNKRLWGVSPALDELWEKANAKEEMDATLEAYMAEVEGEKS